MASSKPITSSLTRSLTRKLTGEELNRLFLEKFKLTLGSELITNGTFATDSDWTKGTGWTIGSGVATHASGTASGLDYSFLFKNGKTYDITFDVLSCSGGSGSVQARGSGSTVSQTIDATTLGANTFRYTDNDDHNVLRIYAGAATAMSIDNVSVKEVTKQAPLAAFSLRKLGEVSPYACRIRRSSDNTEAQVMFDASDRVSESSVVRNTSQNQLSHSENFAHADWPKSNATVEGGQADPFGGNNAYKFAALNTSSNSKIIAATVAVADGDTVTFSVHAKKGELDILQLILGNIDYAGGAIYVNFNLSTGAVTATDGEIVTGIEAVGTDGWYRCSLTATTAAAGNTEAIMTVHDSATATRNMPWAGTAGEGIYIHGSQFEDTLYESTGTEKVTNGDFSNGSTGWVVGGDSSLISVENEAIRINSPDSVFTQIYQDSPVTAGKKYVITADLTVTSGGVAIGATQNSAGTEVTYTSSGSISQTFVATSTSSGSSYYIKRSGAANVLVDNVSVLEFDPIPSEYISTPVVSNDGLTFVESDLDSFVGGENLVAQSEDFSNDGLWQKQNCTQSAGAGTDPNGSAFATKLIPTATTNAGLVRQLGTTMENEAHTWSAHVKKGHTDHVNFAAYVGTTFSFIWFNIANGTVGTTQSGWSNPTITPVGDDGWYRISATITLAGVTNDYLYLMQSDSDNTTTITADGDKGILVWGLQLNTGSSLKPYQKTTSSVRAGHASIVTLYNQTGGEDAIQSNITHQPLLYNAGSLVKSGTSPAIEFDASDHLIINYLKGHGTLDSFYVTNSDDDQYVLPAGVSGTYDIGILLEDGDTSNVPYLSTYGDSDTKFFINGTELSPNTRDGIYEQSKGHNIVSHQNVTTASWTSFQVGIWATFTDWDFTGKISEMVFFNSSQSANRVSIEQDINNFHNIY